LGGGSFWARTRTAIADIQVVFMTTYCSTASRTPLVLTLPGDRVSAITWFFDRGLFPHFGLPRTLHG
jgi:hypothetical protein